MTPSAGMRKPRLLDLFCGSGGAGVGYSRAGFEVIGVDITPQPRYPFDFTQADAIAYLCGLVVASRGSTGADYLATFDAFHASPPCQRYSITRRIAATGDQHPDLVAPIRELLWATRKPYVIENVVGSPLLEPIRLCGTMFDLRVFRHRLFESNVQLEVPEHRQHDGSTGSHRGYSTPRSGRNGFICVAGHNFELAAGKEAMGIDWVTNRYQLSQAIPPAYTEFIGQQLMRAIGR